MAENHAIPSFSNTPAMPAQLAPASDGQGTSGGQEIPQAGTEASVSAPSSSTAAPVPRPQSPSRRTRAGWRGDWQISVVVLVLIAGLYVGIRLLESSHHHSIVLPGTLLGLGRVSGPKAQRLAHRIEAEEKASGFLSAPVAALYGDGAGTGFAVVAGDACPDGSCVVPTAQQLVQAERAAGHADAAAFPPGPPGGLLTCFSYAAQNGQAPEIQCSWIDQVTAGKVLFDGGYASAPAEAAAKTRQLRDAIERA